MHLKSILIGLGMLAFLGACESVSEYGDKMKGWVSTGADNTYVVYFRSNSTGLTEESEGTLFDAMQAIRQGNVKKVRVVAYTDSKGSVRYNQQLSMRRAESIKKRLSGTGAKSIEVNGGGELSAEDGNAGQKARRAEILLLK